MGIYFKTPIGEAYCPLEVVKIISVGYNLLKYPAFLTKLSEISVLVEPVSIQAITGIPKIANLASTTLISLPLIVFPEYGTTS